MNGQRPTEWMDLIAGPMAPVPAEPRVHRPMVQMYTQPAMEAVPTGASPSMAAEVSGQPSVSIQITMPKFALPKLPYKRIGYWTAAAVLCIGLGIGAINLGKHLLRHRSVPTQQGSAGEMKPTFKPLAPEDKPQLAAASDPQTTAYDSTRKLYGFKDNLMGFGVTVTQQALPDVFKKDPGKLKSVADSMGGTAQTIDTAFGSAYIVTVPKSEAQRVVFMYQDKLVFLASYKNFDNDTWKYYIETLR